MKIHKPIRKDISELEKALKEQVCSHGFEHKWGKRVCIKCGREELLPNI